MNRRWLERAAVAALLVGVAIGAGVRRDRPAAEVEARRGGPPSRFLAVDGMRVHYRDQGRGPVLVLLHGSNASLFTWEGWVHELSGDFRMISLDLPGHGLTGPHPQQRYGVDDMAAFVDHVVARLGVERFTLVGNSMGGDVAWHYALRHPTKVERLILLDAVGYPWEEPLPPIFRLYSWPVLGALPTVVTPRFAVAASLRDVYGDPSRVTDDLIDLYEDVTLREGNRDATRIRFRLPTSDALFLRLHEIQAPTLIQWGGRDRWVALKYGRRFESDIPNSRLVVYPSLGHVPMEEDPATTARDARAFLTEPAARPSASAPATDAATAP
jgi:pimeloyl-ACP methyl ester carboxylesterase